MTDTRKLSEREKEADRIRKHEALAKQILLSGIFHWQYCGDGNCINDVADLIEAALASQPDAQALAAHDRDIRKQEREMCAVIVENYNAVFAQPPLGDAIELARRIRALPARPDEGSGESRTEEEK